MKALISVIITIVVALSLSFGLAYSQGKGGNTNQGNDGDTNGKVTLCHIPPGNPDAAHTITVGAPAVDAHLAHGDTLGPCPIPYR